MKQQEYERWLSQPGLPSELRAELEGIRNEPAEIADRFYRELEFGTGGLRGVLGAGTNRMNIYTVRKATQGLAEYVLALPGARKKVAIAHDSRINGRLFAVEAGRVLAANGITAFLYPRLEPTPALSWAVRALGCDAGVCVTASHNPAKYNGYKVYGADGCQITVEAAKAIQQAIDVVDCFDGVSIMEEERARAAGLLCDTPEAVLDGFVDAVYEQRMPLPQTLPPLRVVYTPLNGTGLECVRRILDRIGVTDVAVVPEQEHPDGNFPTCPYPNPEIREALQKGIELCETVQPDLLLATDPDCDRVGIAVKNGGEYVLLSGNEVGVLLLDFICKVRRQAGTMPAAPVAVSTIVSTDMADAVAQKYGVEMRRTLTGFKFIGEQIGFLEEQGQRERYVLGFEESYGYLSGAHVRDKDGVNAAMLICQMAQFHKAQGKNLAQAMEELYSEYGCYQNSLHSFTFEGQAGFSRMQQIMLALRTAPPAEIGGLAVEETVDYSHGVNGLPKADVLEFRCVGGAKAMVRPSGTEPKMKLYLFARGEDRAHAQAILDRLCEDMENRLK